MPRLRAETPARMRPSKVSTQGVCSQADEGGHCGVQARRRDVGRPESVATSRERLPYVIDIVHVKLESLAVLSSQSIIESLIISR